MSIDQYKAFLQSIPSINAELQKEGVALKAPGADEEDEEDEGEPAEPASPKKKKKKPTKKSNIEATSEEESD